MTFPLDASAPPRGSLAPVRSLIFVAVALAASFGLAWLVGTDTLPWAGALEAARNPRLEQMHDAALPFLPALLAGLAAWLLPRPLGRTEARPGRRSPAALWALGLAWLLTLAVILVSWPWDPVTIFGQSLNPPSPAGAGLRCLAAGIFLGLAALPLFSAWRAAPRAAASIVVALCLGIVTFAGQLTVSTPEAFGLPRDPGATGARWQAEDWGTPSTLAAAVALVAFGAHVAVSRRGGFLRWAVPAAFFTLVLMPHIGTSFVVFGASYEPLAGTEVSLGGSVRDWWDPLQLLTTLSVPLVACLLLLLTTLSGGTASGEPADLSFLEESEPPAPGRFSDAQTRALPVVAAPVSQTGRNERDVTDF
ncbi:hypothetical protein DWB68_14625 [Galactobacter valiniphilus]|uniref:Uncharacterized protein n=1 Tax=Galactobacter valiniphilus TaxID=2676122 RepID=A0A399J6Y2_9MICC|nr:hypothetical protein [Galactobacter valiniphilus]RII41074.1 hypothetical protein DWB68_14625 [Galactobacter valiniphilus]